MEIRPQKKPHSGYDGYKFGLGSKTPAQKYLSVDEGGFELASNMAFLAHLLHEGDVNPDNEPNVAAIQQRMPAVQPFPPSHLPFPFLRVLNVGTGKGKGRCGSRLAEQKVFGLR